jgi:hypothetical protein
VRALVTCFVVESCFTIGTLVNIFTKCIGDRWLRRIEPSGLTRGPERAAFARDCVSTPGGTVAK